MRSTDSPAEAFKSPWSGPRRRPHKIGSFTGTASSPYAFSRRKPILRPQMPPSPTSSSKKYVTLPIPVSEASSEEGTALHSRIGNDPIPFSLWNPITKSFRLPTADEIKVIRNAFPTCVEIRFEFPIMVLRCSTPPPIIPLTVAGVPVLILDVAVDFEVIPGEVGNPRLTDPLSSNPYNPEVETSWTFLERILSSLLLCRVGKPVAANMYLGKLVVELQDEEDIQNLPGRIGGVTTFWCTGTPAFNTDDSLHSRLITPGEDTPDNSDYTSAGLTPGIRVAGNAYAGTGGIVLRNMITGERRATVANHVFKDTNEVFHPITSQRHHIGVITERFPTVDLALAKLDTGIEYSNTSISRRPFQGVC
jgi:hypothetical protein